MSDIMILIQNWEAVTTLQMPQISRVALVDDFDAGIQQRDQGSHSGSINRVLKIMKE